jgi:hypothetical protein
MGDNITGIQTIVLSDARSNPDARGVNYTFTANDQAGLTIIGNTGADTITAGGADQTIIGSKTFDSNQPHMAGGFATLIGSTQGFDTFRNAIGDFAFDTIQNFAAPGDVIDVTDVAYGNLSVGYDGGSNGGTLELQDNSSPFGVTSSITLTGSLNPAGFTMADDGHGGTNITYSPAASAQRLASAMSNFSADNSGALDSGGAANPNPAHTPMLAASPTGHG